MTFSIATDSATVHPGAYAAWSPPPHFRVVQVHLLITTILAAINLSPLIGSWTISRIFNMNGEGNLIVWYTSTSLLVLALLTASISRHDTAERQRGWVLVAALFTALSLDEVASFHELAGMLFSERVATIGWLPGLYAWVVVAAPVALVAAALLARWLIRVVPAGTAERRLGIGALATWVLVPLTEALDPLLGAPRALIVLEETLELTGVALMLGAMISIYRRVSTETAPASRG